MKKLAIHTINYDEEDTWIQRNSEFWRNNISSQPQERRYSDMIDNDLVRRKLSRLNMYLEKLKPMLKKNLEEYKMDSYLRFSTESLKGSAGIQSTSTL